MNTLCLLRLTRLVACALLVVAVALGAIATPVAGQDGVESTPETDGESPDNAEVTPTPVIGSASGNVQPPPEDASTETEQDSQAQQNQPDTTSATTETTGPVASTAAGDTGPPVLAQGLIYLSGDPVRWHVRDVELAGESTVIGNARVILQRTGASVIRNDVTGKRARLDPGEAYFASAGDPYTTFPEGNSGSTVWIFEIANNDEVGEGAFYLSPSVQGYGEAVYDYGFARYVVGAGESAEIEGGTGDSFLMVASGNVAVNDGDASASLSARDGLVVSSGSTIDGPNSGEAVVFVMTVGPQVSDTSAADPEVATEPASQPDSPAATETETAEADEPAAPPANPAPGAGEYVTSIQVGAIESVGITLYADGELVFDGWLGAGEWTAFYNGSVFEVYTTSGANTVFNNSCGGDSFQMGFEPGDAYYVLQANEESCAPIG